MTYIHYHFMTYLETENREKFDHDKLVVHKSRTGHKKNWKHKAKESKGSETKEVKKRSIEKKTLMNFFNKKVFIEVETLWEEEREKEFEEEEEEEEEKKMLSRWLQDQ